MAKPNGKVEQQLPCLMAVVQTPSGPGLIRNIPVAQAIRILDDARQDLVEERTREIQKEGERLVVPAPIVLPST